MQGLQGAAAEYLRTRFKGELTELEATVLIGTSVGTVIDSDPDRLGLLVMSLSSNVVYIGIENNVSATNGIRLSASGGSISFNVEDDGMILTRTIYGIATGAGSSVYILSLSRFIADRQTGPIADIVIDTV